MAASAANELRFCLRTDPKTFNPLLVEDESSAAVRYLTGGVLIRLNRYTQELEGELATKWKVSENGRRIDFELRHGVRFSDGTPFTCQDVAYTMRQLMDPALHSPVGDAFRSAPGEVETKCASASAATLRFPGPVAALASQFDEVAILSAQSPRKESAVLGPFEMGEYKPGEYVLLRRNPNYWKRDANGHALPYLDSIRLEIQQNRELELLRFRRGELDIINKLDPDMYDRLSSEMPHAVVDAGPSLDWETVFFNQVQNAPLPEYKRRWFRSADFRRAISEGIRRDDIVRIVYHGHARAAAGPVSVANRFWLNPGAKAALGLRSRCHGDAAACRFPALWEHAGRQRRQQSRVLDDLERRQQAARADAGFDPAGSGAAGHPAQCRRSGFPVADRTHQPHLQLRVGADGA